MPAPLHSPHQPALHGERPANFVGGSCFAERPANCWLLCFFEACAGRRVRRLCLSAAAQFCGLCVRLQWLVQRAMFACCSPLPCHAHCPQRSSPRSVHFVCPLFIPCAPGSTSLQAARLSCWQLQHGPAEAARAPVFDFSCRVHDPGPWVSVNL